MGRHSKWLLFLFILLALSIRLVNLEKGYNSDEGLLLSAADVPLKELLGVLKSKSVYPPLSPLLLHLWTRINDSETGIRLYFVFWGVLLCLLVFLINRDFGAKKASIYGLLLASFSPLLIWASQFIRSYIEAAFWAAASTYFLLRLIKKDEKHLPSWLGYIVTSLFSLYVFYFNIFTLLAQNALICLYYFKGRKELLKKWLAAQVILFLFFIPGMLLAVSQFSNADAIAPYTMAKSYKLLGLHIGLYLRTALAILGFDPSLVVPPALKQLSAMLVIPAFIIPALVAAVVMLRYALRADRALLWLCFFYVFFYMLAVEFLNFPVLTKYFLFPHVLFILIFSQTVCRLKSGAAKVLLPVALIAVYAVRIPAALEPEFDSRKAHSYIMSAMGRDDCLLMFRNTNYYLESERAVIVGGDAVRDASTGDYTGLTPKGRAMLEALKDEYALIWYYKTYSNDEIYGGNKLIQNWLLANGFYPQSSKKLKRIEIIRYIKEKG